MATWVGLRQYWETPGAVHDGWAAILHAALPRACLPEV